MLFTVSSGGIEDLEERVGNLGESLVPFHNGSETLEGEHGDLGLPHHGKLPAHKTNKLIPNWLELDQSLLESLLRIELAAMVKILDERIDNLCQETTIAPATIVEVADLVRDIPSALLRCCATRGRR